MKKTIRLASTLAMTTLLLTGCQLKEENINTLDYLAVQMSEGDNWSIIDRDGKVIADEEYSSDADISEIHDGVFWVKQSGKYQLFSVSDPKNPVIDEEFTWATDFHCGRAAVSNPDEQIRLIDTKGKTVAKMTKDVKRVFWIYRYGYGTFVTKDWKYGVLDTNGKVVLKAQFADISGIFSDYLIVKKNIEDKKLQIIDYKGRKLSEINTEKYELNNADNEGRIIVSLANKGDSPIIVLDKKGKKLFEIRKSKCYSWRKYEFQDGYMAVTNNDDKWGVVNEKGEYVIRTKYNEIYSFGNGEFAAQKGDKWGVVNAKDETLLDFDYDNIIIRKLGTNYVVQDGSTYSVVGTDGGEMTGFDTFSFINAGWYAEYVDVDGLATAIVNNIEDYETPKSPAQLGKTLNIQPNAALTIREYMEWTLSIDNDKVTGNFTQYFSDRVAEDKGHVEKVDDGWFTTEKWVSDGYGWTNVQPTKLNGELFISDEVGVSADLLHEAICKKLADGRKKVSDNTFTKNVKLGGRTAKCETWIFTSDDGSININIKFE